MTFYEPSFLWALGLLIIPILIHLLNLRKYKRVTFSNVEMLKELHTQSRKTRQVKKWLILVSRLLALAFLILAFARPYLPNRGVIDGKTLVSIYLDNSQSMMAEGEEGQIFENSKNVAREILNLLPNDMDVQILDNKLSPYTNRVFAPEQAENLIDNLEADYHTNNLNGVLQRAKKKKTAENYGSHHVFLITDFQEDGTEVKPFKDSSTKVNAVKMVPVSSQNLSIDTAWIEEPIVKPGSPLSIYVKVTNHGSSDVESSTLALKVDEVQQGIESFSIAGNSSEIFEMEISTTNPGWINGLFTISDVPVVFDNNYYFTLLIKSKIRVLSIGENSTVLDRLYNDGQAFDFVQSSPGQLDYGKLSSYDFIILNELASITSGLTEQIGQFAKQGGAVLVIPSVDSDRYTAFSSELNLPYYLSKKSRDVSISAQDLDKSFIADVYKRVPDNVQLPKVFKSFVLQTNSISKDLLKLKDGSSILKATKLGSGTVYQWAMPLADEYSAIVDHEIFVLSMLKMAFSKNEQRQLAAYVYARNPIKLAVLSPEKQLYLEQGENQVILEIAMGNSGTKVWLNDEIQEAGVYSLKSKSGDEVGRLALNYNRTESVQKFYTEEDLKNSFNQLNLVRDNFSDIKSSVDQVSSGKSLWKAFLALSLLFLLIEVLLLRFLKT